MNQTETRRLAAIMMLDVVGYSKMMSDDESGTLAGLRALRSGVLDPLISKHQGRLVKLIGDGALVEFGSVIQAVDCAAAIQRRLTGTAGIKLRIGINLGDVVVDDGDIYGDGVNVAARLEPLARPGGVAVSQIVRDQVSHHPRFRFSDGGKHAVKNISEPVHVFHLLLEGAASGTSRAGRRLPVWAAVAGIAALVSVAVVASVFWPSVQSSNPVAPTTDMVLGSEADTRPSIAVLPFDNLSGDPDQSYFSDGIAQNLITDLSRVSGLLVIARNTSFSFRGQQVNPREIAGEMGVRYLVEGAVQKSGNVVRINASLTDVSSGYQVWAGKLDREFTDLFALQDEVTAAITDALHVELTQEERRLMSKRYTDSLEAYDLYLRAWEELWRFNAGSRLTAIDYLNEAIDIDPGFALAIAMKATTYTNRSGATLTHSQHSLDTAFELAQQAVELDPELPAVQSALGIVHMFRREYDLAEKAHDRAVELDPNFADGYAMRAWNLHFAGSYEQALNDFQYALRLNPKPPFPYLNALGEIYFSLGQYEKAVELSQEALARNPNGQRLRLFLAISYAQLGRVEEAEWEVQELLLLEPDMTISAIPAIAPYKDPAMVEQLIANARLAGVPE